jgi:hypothetical protein
MLELTKTVGETPGGKPEMQDWELEDKLHDEIKALWVQHKDAKIVAHRSGQEFRAIRLTLGERLHGMKALLARTGRGGQWASYLRAAKLPRATADRYVAGYEASQKPSAEKRLTEALCEPEPDATARYITQLMPKVRKALTTHKAIWEFACALVMDLPATFGDPKESGVHFYPPVPLGSDLHDQGVAAPTHPGVVQ